MHPIAIVLAAGAVRKPGGRIEPDPEGKLRCLAARDDLRRGRLEQVFMLGGLRAFGRPVALCYVDYLRRFADPDLAELLPGGIETGSDLGAALRELSRRGHRRPVRVYSSGYHLERVLLLCRILGREVDRRGVPR